MEEVTSALKTFVPPMLQHLSTPEPAKVAVNVEVLERGFVTVAVAELFEEDSLHQRYACKTLKQDGRHEMLSVAGKPEPGPELYLVAVIKLAWQ